MYFEEWEYLIIVENYKFVIKRNTVMKELFNICLKATFYQGEKI